MTENPLYSTAAKLGVDPFLVTRSRTKIHYARVRREDIRLKDIAFHLAHINRWVGSIGRFSVSQHSVLLAQHALVASDSQFPSDLKPRLLDLVGEKKKTFREAFAMALLFHDAEEYITNDIPGPLKTFLPMLGEYGDYLRSMIWRKFEIHEEWYPHCKVWDRRILYNEAEWGGVGRDGVTPNFGEGVVPTLDIDIGSSWAPGRAEKEFIEMFIRLI